MHGLQQAAGFEPEFGFAEQTRRFVFSLGMLFSETGFHVSESCPKNQERTP
jgi:hypothetical protein